MTDAEDLGDGVGPCLWYIFITRCIAGIYWSFRAQSPDSLFALLLLPVVGFWNLDLSWIQLLGLVGS